MRSAVADLPPSALVLVACSGGADSLALAAAAAFALPRVGLRGGAVVVDHHLAAGSGEVTERAAATCRDLGLDPVVIAGVHPASHGGVEGAARAARYEAFERVLRRTGAAAVLLGHTMEDQAETVLLRLARGSGARSLAAMAPVRGVFRRPLLGMRRADLREVCRAVGLSWWEDPGNRAEGPLRRRDGAPLPRAAVREQVLPGLAAALGSDPVPALARTAQALRRDEDLLAGLAGQVLASARDGDRLRHRTLAAAHPALRGRVLHTWLRDQGAPLGALGRGHVAAVESLVVDWHGQRGIDLPGGLRVRREGEWLMIVPAGRDVSG